MSQQRGTWGKWGADDEAGALNRIDEGVVRAAAGLVTEGRTISLAQPLGPDTPVPSHRHSPARFMERDAGDYADRPVRENDFRFAEDAVLLSTHSGTHFDALAHAWTGDELYNGHPAKSTRSVRGATRCGADKLGPVFTRGVLLDFGLLEIDVGIGPEQLEAAYASAGVEPRPADAVLLRTGWWERQRKEPGGYFDGEPGLTRAGAEWLAQREPAVVGADNYAVELLPAPGGEVFPVHLVLLHAHGIPLLENIDLAELAAAGRNEFLFVATPLPLVGSVGSPTAPVAVL